MLNCSTHLNLPEETLRANRSVVSLACGCRETRCRSVTTLAALAHSQSRVALHVICHLAIHISSYPLLTHPVRYRSADRHSASPLHARGPNNRHPSPLSSSRHTRSQRTGLEDRKQARRTSKSTCPSNLDPSPLRHNLKTCTVHVLMIMPLMSALSSDS